jgi:hypothetical protein
MRKSNLSKLAMVLAVAVLLRIIAVIYAQGYMASDDHHETVKVAWQWNGSGRFLNDDGKLTWGNIAGGDIMRSPFYNFFVYSLMKVGAVLGMDHLDQMMYIQRIVHALLSLILVIFVYKYLKEEADENTALIGSLIMSAFFIMPYLSVRNLIEMVSAELMLPSLYYAHLGIKRENRSYLIVSGLLGGLAWMIRPQTLLAVIPIIPVLWFSVKSFGKSLYFILGLAIIMIFSGLLDLFTVGKFLGTSIKYFTANMSARPWLPGPWYQYILLLLGIFIFPFSLLFLGSIFRKKLISRNKIIFWGFIFFLAVHSLYRSKEERFMIPIIPLAIILGFLGIYYLYQKQGWYFRMPRLRRGLWIYFGAVNLILLVPFTINYSHKGRVEPLIYLSRQTDAHGIIFDCTERNFLIPYEYLGKSPPPYARIIRYSQLDSLTMQNPNYIVIFADENYQQHIDSLKNHFLRLEIKSHSAPSAVDYILHVLNPKYNHTNEAYVVKGHGWHENNQRTAQEISD